jgi:hypothetical protein
MEAGVVDARGGSALSLEPSTTWTFLAIYPGGRPVRDETAIPAVGPDRRRAHFRELPLPEAGDIAILRDAGAYGATMSSNYNTRPLAPEVMLDAGALSVVRKCQSVEQLLDLEADRGRL